MRASSEYVTQIESEAISAAICPIAIGPTGHLNKIETKNLQMHTNKAGIKPKVEIATNTTISDKSKFNQGAKG